MVDAKGINLLPGMPGVVGAARRIPASHFSRAAPKRNRLFSIAKWLQNLKALQVFLPVAVLLYTIWSIPLRLVFLRDYTFSPDHFVFTTLDYLTDALVLLAMFVATFTKRHEEKILRAIVPLGMARPQSDHSGERFPGGARGSDVGRGGGNGSRLSGRIDRPPSGQVLHSMQSIRKIVESTEKNLLVLAVQQRQAETERNMALSTRTIHFAASRWRRYSHNAFLFLCALSVFPFEVAAFAVFEALSGDGAHVALMPYRCNRLLLLLASKHVHDRLYNYLEEKRWLVNSGLQRMVTLFVVSAVAGHLAACSWFLVGLRAAEDGQHQNWAELYGGGNHPLLLVGEKGKVVLAVGWATAYLRSLYWALITMITAGYGDIVPTSRQETCLAVGCFYAGLFLCTVSIGNLTSLFLSLDRAFTEHQAKTDALTKYMSYRKLPRDLTDRVVAFYEYHWLNFKGVNEQQILSELPSTLKQQVANQITCDLLRSLPILRKSPNALLNALSSYIESSVYSPADEIVGMQETMTGALLVSRGKVEVIDYVKFKGGGGGGGGGRGTSRVSRVVPLNKVRKVLRHLERGEYYGMLALFQNAHKSANAVEAKTYCEVFTLPAPAFQQISEEQCTPAEVNAMLEMAEKSAKSSLKMNRLVGGVGDTLAFVKGVRVLLLPSSRFRRVWDCFLFVGLVYYCFSLPLWVSVAYPPHDSGGFEGNATAFAVAFFVDTAFAADFLLRFKYLFFLEDGILVVDPDRIRSQFYKDSSVAFEVGCCVPWELLALWFGHGYAPLLRCLKVPRLLHLPRHLAKAERDVQRLFVNMSTPVRRLLILNLAMYLLCHWVGCVFALVGRIEEHAGGHSWIAADRKDPRFSFPSNNHRMGGSGIAEQLPAFVYLRAVYWAIVGMSTVGYGDIVPYGTAEMLFATLVILFGGLIVPAMVGGLAACVSNLNEVQAQHLAKITRVRALLRRKNYPPEQAARVLRFYNYLWSRQGGVDEVSILNELPGPLRQRVSLFIAGGALKGLPFFEGVPEAVLNSLVAMVVPRMFVPGDVIMQAGEIGKVMYVIEKGSVYVSSEDGKVELAVVGAGECFGESCLLGRAVVRSSTVKCFDYCDCFELSRLDFLDALAPFGEEQKDLIVAEVKRCFDRKLRDNDCLAKNVRNHRSKLLQRVESFHLHDMLNSNHHRNHHHHHDHDGAVLFPPPPPPPAAFLAASALGVDRGDNAPAPPLHASSFRSFVVKLKFSAAGLLSKLCSRAFRSIGFIRRVWSSALLCAYLYNAVAIPFRLGFLPLYSLRRFGLDYAFDALLVTDVYLCLRWFGVEEPGGGGSSSSSRWPTTNHAQVQAAYVESGRLGWDLAGSIPYDAVAAAVCLLAWSPTTVPGLEGEEDSGSGSSTSGGGALASIRLSLLLALLRLPKLLHCSKVTPLVRSLTQALYDRFPHSINMTVLHLLQLLGGVLLVSHWAGCGFFALARYKNFSRACDEFASFSSSPATVPSDDVLLASTDVSIPEELSSLLNGAEWFNPNRLASPQSQCIWENTWVLLQIEESKLSPNTVPDGPGHSSGSSVSQYIRALNWALPTLVVVVIGDVLPTSSNETLYVFVSILLGMTVNAVIIGNIAGLVANLETDSAAHTARSDALSAYMHHHTVPQALQARVMQYMGSVWTHHQGETVEDEVDVLTTLPVTIQQDLAECSKLPFIQSCPFFDFCSYEVQRALAGCLETLRFSSGDVIVQCGDMGAEMFFLVQGRAKVVAADEVTVFAELGPGAFFGEQSLFLPQERSATVLAADYCEVLLLTTAALQHELSERSVGREFDWETMVAAFETIKSSNQRRNDALAANLAASRRPGKLHKIVFPALTKKRIGGDGGVIGGGGGSGLGSGRGSTGGSVPPEKWASWACLAVNHAFRPGSFGRGSWDFVSFGAVLHCICSVPHLAAFPDPPASAAELFAEPTFGFDVAFDVFWIIDMVLCATVFCIVDHEEGVALLSEQQQAAAEARNVTPQERRWKHLKSSRFAKDALASLPVELLCLAPQVGVGAFHRLRLIRLVRGLRLFEYTELLERSVGKAMGGVRVSASMSLLCRIFLVFVLTNHLCCCAWFGIHRFEVAGSGGGPGKKPSSLHSTWATTSVLPLSHYDEDAGRLTICDAGNSVAAPFLREGDCYTRAFYMVTSTLTSVGYGDIYPTNNVETLWGLCVVLLACVLFASIIGAWQALLKQVDETGDNAFKDKITRLLTYMDYREFNPELKNAVVLHYTHLWHSTRCLDQQDQIVSELPAPLRMEIAHVVVGNALAKVPVLLDCAPQRIRMMLAAAMRKQIAAANTHIYEVGDIGWEVFFIGSGAVRVLLSPEDRAPGDGSEKGTKQRGLVAAGSKRSSGFIPGMIGGERGGSLRRAGSSSFRAPSSFRSASASSFRSAGSFRSGGNSFRSGGSMIAAGGDDGGGGDSGAPGSSGNGDSSSSSSSSSSSEGNGEGLKTFIQTGDGGGILASSPLLLAKQRAKVLGVVYREGNHFGEGCVVSLTGARVEDASALTVVEMFTISQDRLEDVLAVMTELKREKFLSALLSRNGDTIHTQVEFPDPPPPPAAAPTSPAGVADDDLAQSTSTSTTQKIPSVEVLSNSMMLLDNFLADRKKHKTQANGKIKKMSGKTKTAALTAFAAAGKKGGAFGIITAVSSGDHGSSGGGDPPPSDSEIKAGSLLKGGNAFGQPGQLGSWRSSRSQQPKMDSISEKVKDKLARRAAAARVRAAGSTTADSLGSLDSSENESELSDDSEQKLSPVQSSRFGSGRTAESPDSFKDSLKDSLKESFKESSVEDLMSLSDCLQTTAITDESFLNLEMGLKSTVNEHEATL